MTTMIGKDYYLEFNGVVITGPNRSFTPGESDETAEGSASRSTLRNYVVTLTKVEPKGKFIVNSADTTILAALKKGQSGTLIWGPDGNAAGKTKYGIEARITKSERTKEYDKEQELEVEWVNTADGWTFDPASATF